MKATQPSTASIDVEASSERFDCLLRLAGRHFGVSTILIVLINANRLWFRSYDGLSFKEVTCDFSLHARNILDEKILLVSDTLDDERFKKHSTPIEIPGIRFYAGCLLTTSAGNKLGAFCLVDTQPRELSGEQIEALQDFAHLATATIERDIAEAALKSKVAALHESEERMALAIAGSDTGIWDRNVQTNEIHYSTGWKAILGFTDDEITSLINDSYQRVHPDDLAYVQATMQAHFDQKTPSYEVEHRLRCKDGSYIWVSSRGKVVSRDRHGQALRLIGTTTDITTMRAISEQLQQNVDLITNLTNEVPGLVFQYRLLPCGASFFSYASADIKGIYELEPEQVAVSAAVMDEIIHPDDLRAYHDSLAASAANLTPWHLEYRVRLPRQGLRWRLGDARPQRLEDGGTLWHGFITDVTERKRTDAELRKLASTDFLTLLPNRRHFMAQIETELKRIQRNNIKPAAVLMFDLDHFKSINDKWGHATGDSALRHFADVLRNQLRKADLAGRVGGEEFAVMLHAADLYEATAFARRLQRQIAATPLLEAGQPIKITASVGIAAMTAADSSANTALSRSDQALYHAKSSGRNRIICN